MPERNKILMDLITDSIQGGGGNADANQQLRAVFDRQGLIGSEKEDPQQRIGPEVQEFIQKTNIRHAFGARVAGLKIDGRAVNNWRQPVKKEDFKF